MKTAKRTAWLLFCFLVVPAIAWIGGFDFDQRGGDAASVAVLTILAVAFGFLCF